MFLVRFLVMVKMCRAANILGNQPFVTSPWQNQPQQSMKPAAKPLEPPAVGAALGGGNRQQVWWRAVGRTLECLGWFCFKYTSRGWWLRKGREGKGKQTWRGGGMVPQNQI